MRFEGELVPVETIPLAFAALRDGSTDFACVPIENSVEGAVATLDALVRDEPVVAVAETVLDVRFSVLVRPGTPEIRTIASHPHALAQVREWIAATLPGVTSIATSSTASAAAAVERGEFDAAVSAPVAVNHYKLDEYATDILDVPDARTRFLLLQRPGQLPEPTGADRTSVVVTTPDRVGVLSELLTELALRGINLTGLESRPQRANWGRTASTSTSRGTSRSRGSVTRWPRCTDTRARSGSSGPSRRPTRGPSRPTTPSSPQPPPGSMLSERASAGEVAAGQAR